ncbi:hypothetical protein LXL04_024708 [Taraxacum kok-saghyz]
MQKLKKKYRFFGFFSANYNDYERFVGSRSRFFISNNGLGDIGNWGSSRVLGNIFERFLASEVGFSKKLTCWDLLRTHIFPRTRELPQFPISPKPLFLSKNRLRNPPKPVLKQNKKLCTYAQKKSLHICKSFFRKKIFATGHIFERFLAPRSRFIEKVNGLGVLGSAHLLLPMELESYRQCGANYVPLSPISFLQRAAFVYEQAPSIIYGDVAYTWKETHDRCLRLASALSVLGVNIGQVVVALGPNVPALYELHFGVPMAGAILSALNTSLDSPSLAITLQQLEPKIIFLHHQHLQTVLEAFRLLPPEESAPPRLVLITKKNSTTFPPNTLHYNDLLSLGNPDFKIITPNNECDPISINFTSGSTGRPKGAIYSHRAAYLNSLAVIFQYDMRKRPVFLWTVDMFRCNGWCFPWAVAALGGTNICIEEVTSEVIFDSIVIHKVTHLCGPPTILEMIASSNANKQPIISSSVDVIVAGVLPPLEILSKVERFGFKIHHGYGMTEALGPMTHRSIRTSNEKDNDHNNMIRCREGTHNILMEDVDVKDPETMKSVPLDGKTIGEVVFRGNVVMSGYLKNLERTEMAFKGGWYRTGDLGVRNHNGDIVIKDRVIDSIVYKGEIVSTIEIEQVIRSHPLVKEVAVVGKHDHVLGQSPCAFVTLKDDCCLSSKDIIKFCEDELLPPNMIPTHVIFGILPKNSTGKVMKFVLRENAKNIEGNTNGH